MKITRLPQPQGTFIVVQDHYIKDCQLSMEAKGLLTYLLSLPESWELSVLELSNHFTNGRYSVQRTLKELREKHYVSWQKKRGVAGRYGYNQYIVSSVARHDGNTTSENTAADIPASVTPPADNQAQENNGITKDTNNKKPIKEKNENKNNDKSNTQDTPTSQGKFTRTLDFQTQLRIKAHLDKVLQFTEQQMELPRYGKFLAGIYASLCYAKGFGNTEISKAINSIGKLIREGRWQTPIYYAWANEHCEVMDVIAQMQAFYQELNESRNTLKSQLCKYDANYRSKQEARVRHAESQIAALQVRLSVDVSA